MKTKNLLLVMLFFHHVNIFSQGKVGINTTDPQSSLHVGGNLRVDSIPFIDTVAIKKYFHVVSDSFGNIFKLNQKLSENAIILEYGETILTGDAVSLGDGLTGYNTISQNNNSLNISIDSGNYVAQSFITTNIATGIRAVSFYSTSGQTNFTASIRNFSGGIPTGSDLGVTSYYSAGTSIGEFTLVFNPPVSVLPNTEYAFLIRFTRPGVNVRFYYDSTDPYLPGAFLESSNGAVWTSRNSDDLCFKVYETQTVPGKVYKSKIDPSVISPSATSFFTAPPNTFGSGEKEENFLGIAEESGSKDDLKKVSLGPIFSNFVCIPGRVYYLSNIPGVLSLNPGSVIKIAGFGLDNNNFLIKR